MNSRAEHLMLCGQSAFPSKINLVGVPRRARQLYRLLTARQDGGRTEPHFAARPSSGSAKPSTVLTMITDGS
jgi:hypothetical protein